MVILLFVSVCVAVALFVYAPKQTPKVYVVQAPAQTTNYNTNQNKNQHPNQILHQNLNQNIHSIVRPDLYPEPVQRFNLGFGVHTRGAVGPIQQVGILTGEGGSSSSAAPDRTILPLYGRELDVRRGRWNYYTRTDGTNPVQVPVRVKNRVCDDDTNGCDEVYSDDPVHVPALGRSFKATVYRKSIF